MSSTALTATESMYSSMAGRNADVIASTAPVASASVANVATAVAGAVCAGSRRSVTSVITPRIPSLPTINLVNESPAQSFSRGPPRRTAVPSARTTCIPST
jgi:hypothetical protein